MQQMNVVADVPPVPPRRKKKLKSKMPTIIINSPEETSLRFKAKRSAPPPPPPRRLKSKAVKTERKKSNAMIDSSKVGNVREPKEGDAVRENLNTNSTVDKPSFVFETLLKKESNKYPPLFFTLNDFQNVIASESSVEQCQEDSKGLEDEDKNSVQENSNEIFVECSATSCQQSPENLNDYENSEECSGQFSNVSNAAYRSIEGSFDNDQSLQESLKQDSFNEESFESPKSSIDNSSQEDSYKNSESIEFAQESYGKSLKESFGQFFEQSFANSLEDEETDLCFRVTTTNLPFGKCLDRFRESYDESNHFIFENYMDRSNKVNIRRSAGPMSYDSFSENFQECEEPSRFTKVRFIIESPSTSTIDYSLEKNDLYDTNAYNNNDGEASNDSLQNIEPIEDEEQVFNHEPIILTLSKDVEAVDENADDIVPLVNEDFDWGCRINSVILTEITDDADLDKVFDGEFNKSIQILTNNEDLVEKSLSHDAEIHDIKEDINCNSNDDIDKKSLENFEESNRELFELEDASKSFDEKIKQISEKSLENLEEDKKSTDPKKEKNETEVGLIEKKENTGNIVNEKSTVEAMQNQDLIKGGKSVNKNREHKRKFLESDSFRNRVSKCDLEEKIEKTSLSSEEHFENQRRESISVPVNIRRNSFLENMLSDSSDIWKSCEVMADNSKSLDVCTESISEETVEKELKESEVMNDLKSTIDLNTSSTTETTSRKPTPRKIVQANERSTGEVKCDVLNELLSNFDKIKLKPVMRDRETKKGLIVTEEIIKREEENNSGNQKEIISDSEEAGNAENNQELNTGEEGLKGVENIVGSNDERNTVLKGKDTEKKTGILYSEKTDIIKGDLMNNLPGNSCNRSPNDLPNELANQDLKLIRTGINKADNNDNSINNRGEKDSAIISKLTSSGSHHCNGDCNYDNNGTATPIGILNKDQAVVTPGKVRKFVNYYEIRREATINNDSTVSNCLNNNYNNNDNKNRVDKVVPGHQSVFSIRRSLELKETVKNEPRRSLKKHNHYSEGSIDFTLKRNKFSNGDNSNAALNSGMAYTSVKKVETNDRENDNSGTIVAEAKSLNNDDVNCQIITQIVVTNEFDELIESDASEIVDHKIGIDNDSDIITGNFREDHRQAITEIKKKKSVKFENGFTIIGAKSPGKNLDEEGDGRNKCRSNNTPKNNKKKRAPAKPTLKASCLGMKIDLKRKDGKAEESSNVKEARAEQKETTTLQIQSTTILNEDYYSGINNCLLKAKPETPCLVFYCTI